MKTIQNDRLCAVIVLIGGILILVGSSMLTGVFEVNPIREGVEIALLIWLATGSTIARWIIGILSALVVVVAIIGGFWLVSNGLDISRLAASQQLAHAVVALAVAAHGYVAWRLLLRPRQDRTKYNKEAEQGGDGDAEEAV
ncbi:hypothetical protein [Luteolibacter sp. AS25]|uniref:hypothetical protein n=1 Tax=Luteolibacter sp. AS25 TaxID=3135776 RepID=UPI00398B1875